jgi:hypothetical protein
MTATRTRVSENQYVVVTGNAATGYIGVVASIHDGHIIAETGCYGSESVARRMAVDLSEVNR